MTIDVGFVDEWPLPETFEAQRVDVALGAPRLPMLRMLRRLVGRHDEMPVRILCAAPGDGIVPPRSQQEGLTLDRRLSKSGAAAWMERLCDVFGMDLDRASKTNAVQRELLELSALIDKGHIQFRFIDRALNDTRALVLHGDAGPVSLVGAGGCSPAALEASDELRTFQTGEQSGRVARWFEQQWEQALDITEQMASLLTDCWACRLLSPEDAYHKALVEYFREMLDRGEPLADDNPMVEHLADFQKDAYSHAKGILRRFGGVFVSDVVGLGKTFIGLALLKYSIRRHRAKPLIVAPPRLCDMWEELTLRYGIEKEVLSNYQLEKLGRYTQRDLVLVDESHAFRNKDTNRYEHMMEFLRPEGRPSHRRVILLTATPQNNSCWDVFRQLKLFPDTYAPLPHRGESLKDFFHRVDDGHADLSSLMQHVLVRRTRRFIQEEYPNATMPVVDDEGNRSERPIVFPERRDGPDMALRYSIADAYDGLYDQILETLRDLTYARYGLFEYLREPVREMEKYNDLIRSGPALRGLFKVNLLKRCESSLEAFKKTLSWLIETHKAFYSALVAEGEVRTNPEHVGAAVEMMELEDVMELFQVSYPADDFERERLAEDIEHDWGLLEDLRDRLEDIPVEHDAKFQRLREQLQAHHPTEHKTLLFTQFTDTAEYLYEHLTGDTHGLDCTVERITSETSGQLKVMKRFAPSAMEVDEPPDDDIDLLISTDVLAEGVNLQDADTILNYDLHWNPVRLIQRAGRIDRIGSEHDVIYIYNFLPDLALDEALGLEEVLRRRVREIRSVFGEDGSVLPSSQNIEEREVIDTYTGDALRESEEDHLSHHLRKAFELQRNQPDRYRTLSNLRPGQRAMVAPDDERSVVMAQAGWFKQFYTYETGEGAGGGEHVDDERALGILAEWAECDDWVESQTIHAALNSATREAFERFESATANLRDQRNRPKLTSAQQFVCDQLVELRKHVDRESARTELDEMIEWVRRGRHKILFEEYAKDWRRNDLAPEAIRGEMRGWLRERAEAEEPLTEPELVVSVLGPGA